MSRLLTKAEFAAAARVSRSCVSKWIERGKIGRDALVGDGPDAKIDVERATEQLKIRLDAGQRMGNGAGTDLSTPAAEAETPATEQRQDPQPRPRTEADELELRIKRERAWREEAQNRKLLEEERLRAGIYTLTADHQAAVARVLRQTLTLLEADIPETANAIAAKFEVPQRDVLLMLRKRFNEARGRVSAQLAAEAATEPATKPEDPAAEAA